MDLASWKVRRLDGLAAEPLSLEELGGGADGADPGDVEDGEAVSPFDAALDSELRVGLRAVLATLTRRERRVLHLRFGFDDGAELSYEEVGRRFGLSADRIRQIQSKALRKLRHPSRASLLREFLER